jgi:hypothetical protein
MHIPTLIRCGSQVDILTRSCESWLALSLWALRRGRRDFQPKIVTGIDNGYGDCLGLLALSGIFKERLIYFESFPFGRLQISGLSYLRTNSVGAGDPAVSPPI